MTPLLVADLRALWNLVRFQDGRRTLLGGGAVLLLLAALSWTLGNAVLRNPEIRGMLLQTSGGSGTGGGAGAVLVAAALGPAFVLAVWYGLSAGHRLLFETPEVDLCASSPVPPRALVLHSWIRGCWLAGLHGLALAGPATGMMLAWLHAPAGAFVLLPVAVLLCMAPVLAIAQLAHLLLARFASGRWLQVALGIAMAVASLAISVLLVATAFADGEDLRRLATSTDGGTSPPLFVAGATSMLLSAWQPAWDHVVLLRTLGAVTAAVLLLVLSADLHPRAVECDRAARDRRRTRRSAVGRTPRENRGIRSPDPIQAPDKPRDPALAIAIKELCAFREQPRAALGLLLSSGMLWWLSRDGGLTRAVQRAAAPWPGFAGVCVMLALALLGLLLLLPAHTPRLVLADARSWSLYAGAPIGPGALLRGKLVVLLPFAVWPFLVAAALGVLELDVPPASLRWFALLGPACALAALGAVAAVGTWPRLVRGDLRDRTNLGLRALFAALLSIAALDAVGLPLTFPWAIAAATSGTVPQPSLDPMDLLGRIVLVEAVLFGAGGLLLARRNLRKLLQPA